MRESADVELIMGAVECAPLYALSLARTALDDPAAIPDGEGWNAEVVADAPRITSDFVDPARADFAVAQIDRAIGGLYFEPFDDPAREASLPLANLGRLLALMIEGLEACGSYQEAVTNLREAAAKLNGAKAILHAEIR